jgi:hypothetical protein
MMATEMPAAIRPYSIAVAPDSSFAKRFTRLLMNYSLICPAVAASNGLPIGK